MTRSGRDPHSYAVPEEASVRHVELNLRADFARRILAGRAVLTLDVEPGAQQVVLDVDGLDVEAVTDATGADLGFEIGRRDPVLGSALRIRLSSTPSPVRIRYRTRPDSRALQWLSPSQTAGGQQPFLYSQGQAILTRTWIPTQDSPGIRQTFHATLTVPADLHAVMAAAHAGPAHDVDGGREFQFRLDRPVPPYLIALAVGDLAFRRLGDRTGVYAEPSVVDLAAYEFADLERMVATAESIGGPYRWGRFDVLVLPPSFPFGGMENPCLTFVTPTILTGDRSLTSLVAHELAHAWAGNLVTNATWQDFWLNEGFTTYFENRIMEALYGKPRARLLQALGRGDLAAELERLAARPHDQILAIDLAGRDPDDGATQVPYEKGALFVRALEEAVGRPEFDRWLRAYFDRHAFQSITTARFLADLRATLMADPGIRQRVPVDSWIFEPGLPDVGAGGDRHAFRAVETQAAAFAIGSAAESLETDDWSPQEWIHFVRSIPDAITGPRLAELDRAFAFSDSRNSEVLFAWLRVAIRHRYEPALPALARFLTSQGRRKFLKPLYEDLVNSGWGRALAAEIYGRARPLYHAVSAKTIDEIVGRPQ